MSQQNNKRQRYKDASHTLGQENEEQQPEQQQEQDTREHKRGTTLEERNKAAEEQMMFEGEKWWETGTWKAEMNVGGIVEMSDFTILFPQYREMYFKQIWPLVEHILCKQMCLDVKIDYEVGTMTISTTTKTFDPVAILQGRDLLLLMSRGMNLDKAKLILQPGYLHDIIKTKRYVRNYKVFMNRRQRLLGPSGATLKAIELLTGCTLVIQGKTVSVVGTVKGLKEVRRIVEDCMNNIHPIYHVKVCTKDWYHNI